MSSYTEIDTALLDLDFTNPRIQNYLQNYPEESRSGELLAMLLGTGTDSCASLKESIKEHGGIINPIIVNHFPDGRDEAMAITDDQYKMLMQGLEVVARHPITEVAKIPDLI